jgi:hypothetical protein
MVGANSNHARSEFCREIPWQEFALERVPWQEFAPAVVITRWLEQTPTMTGILRPVKNLLKLDVFQGDWQHVLLKED